MTIYDRIKQLREERGLSQQELAERVGFKTASAVNKIELGLRDINQTKIMAFADALGVTPGYLMGDSENEEKPVYRVPVLGVVRAGLPMLAVENIIDYEELPNELRKQGSFFGLVIKGDSMEPRMVDGDVVIVKNKTPLKTVILRLFW